MFIGIFLALRFIVNRFDTDVVYVETKSYQPNMDFNNPMVVESMGSINSLRTFH